MKDPYFTYLPFLTSLRIGTLGIKLPFTLSVALAPLNMILNLFDFET